MGKCGIINLIANVLKEKIMIKYWFNKFKNINKSRFSKFASQIALENNCSKTKVLVDMIKSFIIYGSGYTDYMKGNYINLNHKERKNFITDRKYRKMINYLNDEKYQDIFLDKIKFNDKFKNFIKRDYLDLRKCNYKTLEKFIKDKDDFFVKKHNKNGGDGVEKIVVSESLDVKKLYKKLIDNEQYLVEETIIQHDYFNKVNPSVVNNIRMVTLLKDNKVYLLFNTIRLNDGNVEVINCEDIFATILDNGKIVGNMVDAEFNIYEKHPVTDFDFSKLQVPYMKEAIEMVKEAALVVPEIRFVGWDVAITNDGPCLIEGNFYPSYGLFQYYLFNDGKPVGKLPLIKEILNDEAKKI